MSVSVFIVILRLGCESNTNTNTNTETAGLSRKAYRVFVKVKERFIKLLSPKLFVSHYDLALVYSNSPFCRSRLCFNIVNQVFITCGQLMTWRPFSSTTHCSTFCLFFRLFPFVGSPASSDSRVSSLRKGK